MTAILSLISALLYGIADFAGGHATRKNSVFSVMLVTQAVGALVALTVYLHQKSAVQAQIAAAVTAAKADAAAVVSAVKAKV